MAVSGSFVLGQRKYLFSALACLLLSVQAQTAGAAQAPAELKATAGWSVSRAADDKGAPYCTLSRPYSDNSVLSFARNVREEYSVAFDFQKSTLDTDTPYAVTLQPGLGQLRAFEILPASARALVVRLGFDEGFIDALAESGALKVQVAEKRYSYTIDDFAAGLNDLQACLQNEQADAGEGTPLDPVEAKIKEQDIKLLADATTKKDAAAVQEESHSPSLDLLAMEPAAGGDFKARKMTAAPALPAAEVEIAAVEPVVPPAPAPAKPAAKDAPLPVDSEALLKAEEKSALPAKSKTKSEEARPSEAAASAQHTPPEESPAPKAQKISSEEYRILANARNLEQQNAELRRKNDTLLKELAQSLSARDEKAREEITQSMKRAAELESKLSAAQEDNKALSAKLEDALLVKEDAAMKQAQGNQTMEQLTARLNEAERTAQRTAQDLERERTSCTVKTAKLEEMLFDPVVTDKAQQDRLTTLEQELKLAQEKLNSSQGAVDQRVAEMRKQVEEQGKAQTAELQQKISSLEAELHTAKEREGQAQQSNTQLTLAQTDLSLARANLAKVQSDLLTAQGEAASAQQKVAALNTEVAALKLEQAKPDPAPALQQKISTLEGTLAAVNVEKKALEDQNTVMSAELSKLRIHAGEIQASEAGRADRLASLQIENERLKHQLGLKEKESSVFRNETAKLQQELSQTQSRLYAADAKAAQNTSGQETLKSEVQALRSQVHAMERQHKDTISKLQSDRYALEQALARTAPAAAASTPLVAPVAAAPSVAPQQVYEAAVAPAPAPQTNIYESVAKAPAVKAPVTPPAFTQQSLEAMLSNAGIAAEGLRRVSATNTQEAFAWTAGGLKGRGIVQQTSSFVQAVDTYIASLKQSCGGDFASIPTQEGRGRSSYEIACITPQESRSSSVLFFEKEGRFIALSHETDAADMDVAMDARDRLMAQAAGLTSAAW